MTKEQLVELLKQSGLAEEEIVALLQEALAEFQPKEEEEPQEEKEQVLNMLGAN